jgi:hypothetical protein
MKIKTITTAAVAVLMTAAAAHAEKLDPRLAQVRKAYVLAVDELGEDVSVASCLAERLPSLTPIKVVANQGEADVILRVKAHLPSTTTKALVGIMGGSPSMRLSAELPDGTKLWEDGAKYRASMMKQGQWGAGGGDTAKNVECGLAERGIEALRNAMREARGK